MGDEGGSVRFGYGGDFGDAPNDGEFCGNGIFFADHSPTPKAQELAHAYQGIRTRIEGGRLEVSNEFAFTDCSAFDCVVELAREGDLLAREEVDVVLGPGESGSFPLPFALPEDAGEYTITVRFLLRSALPWARVGHVIAQDQGIVEVRGDKPPRRRGGGLELVEGRHNIGVRGEGFSVLFSRVGGGLQSYQVGRGRGPGRELLRGMPTVNFWHAPTSNERGWGGPAQDGQWLLASRYAAPVGFESLRAAEVGETIRIEWSLRLPTVPAGTCDLAANVFADGTVRMEVVAHPGAGLTPPPEFGILFALDPRVEFLRWYGDGPEETSADRRGGALLGVYESEVSKQFVPYLRPQECGAHTGTRWASVTDLTGTGIRFSAETPMEFSALPWSPFEIENAAHPWELPTRSRTWVRAICLRRGAGGDDAWGARVLPQYELPEGDLRFAFSLRGLLGE